MSEVFPKHIEEMLQDYRVPAMSEGFADRVVAAALSGPGSATVPVKKRSWRRFRSAGNNPWSRGRYIASGVVGMAMVSTAAAAALSLANLPYRIPVLTELVEKVIPLPAEPPKALAKTENRALADKAVAERLSAPDTSEVKPVQKRWREMDREERIILLKQTSERIDERVQQRRLDRGLPPLTEQQLKMRRAAFRQAVRNGSIPKPVARKAIQRAVVREQILQRRETEGLPVKREGQANAITARAVPTPMHTQNANESVSNGISAAPSRTGEKPADSDSEVDTEPAGSAGTTAVQPEVNRTPISPELKQKLQDQLPDALKIRLQNASPAERRRILRAFRNRYQSQDSLRDARKRLRDIRNATK